MDENNFLHNENGKPGLIDTDAEIIHLYYFHGLKHNLNGTVKEIYSKEGEKYISKSIDDVLFGIYYALNGKKLSKEQWEIESNRIKMLSEV